MTDEELRYFENILEKGNDFCKTLIDDPDRGCPYSY